MDKSPTMKKENPLAKKAFTLAVVFMIFQVIISFFRSQISFMVPPLMQPITSDLGIDLGLGGTLQTSATLMMGVGSLLVSLFIDRIGTSKSRLHTNGVINSAEFSAQSSEINNKISTLRTKRRKKLSDDENDAWFDTLNSLNEILEAYDPSNNFDEELFEKIVVGITVNSNADLTFKLIGDIELTEEIPLKGRCRRRENS